LQYLSANRALKNSVLVCYGNKQKLMHNYALSAVYVNDEQLTVSPEATVKPPVMFISEPEAATAH
jgi:hypothetical protein